MEKGAPFVCRLTMVLDFSGGLGASANTPSCGHGTLRPPSGLVHTANSSPPPVDCALSPEIQALPVPADACLRPGRAGRQCSSAPVCADVSPAGREWGLCSPLSLPFCPCCCEGASQDAGTAPLFSSLPGVHVPPLHPLFFFLPPA